MVEKQIYSALEAALGNIIYTYISLSLNGNKVRAHEDGDYTGLLQAQMYLLTMMKKCIIFFLGFGKFCMRVQKMST